MKQNLNNVNIYSRKNIKEIMKNQLSKPITKVDQEAVKKINEFKSKSIINYPCGSGDIFNLLDDDTKKIFIGIDHRVGFIEQNIYDKDKKDIHFIYEPNLAKQKVFNIDVLFAKDFIESSLDPIKALKKIIKDTNLKNIVLSCEMSTIYNHQLNDRHMLIRLDNNARFIHNLYDKKAIKSIAKEFNLNVEYFKEDKKEYALIFGTLEVKKTKIKPKKTTENKSI